MKLKINNRVRVIGEKTGKFFNQCGTLKQITTGGDGGCYVTVEMELGGKETFLAKDVKRADVRFEKGARVRVLRGTHEGQTGTVDSSFTKYGQPRCWVELDGKGGGQTGFARVDLERLKVAKGQVSLPDPEGKNVLRAGRAGKTLKFYRPLSGAGGLNVPTCETVADLLCDLAHWADRNGEDFGAMLLSASTNYSAETGGKGLQMSKFIMC